MLFPLPVIDLLFSNPVTPQFPLSICIMTLSQCETCYFSLLTVCLSHYSLTQIAQTPCYRWNELYNKPITKTDEKLNIYKHKIFKMQEDKIKWIYISYMQKSKRRKYWEIWCLNAFYTFYICRKVRIGNTGGYDSLQILIFTLSVSPCAQSSQRIHTPAPDTERDRDFF